ncbi:MAG: beta-lactamase family protein [Canidatus Methanoxibalbensis ujae]|nr:beta-lactamase family protein [Candidatus Methanoxibalbensis ujae]MCW7078967.1 beta-lactamase family protein [Candidatus Methanoxibalbensis ujae]
MLDNYSAKKAGVGLQATVIFPDGTVWSGVSGYASHEKKCPLTLDHHLYIGSMTKLYTATLVMEQVENGTIALDDPLSKWIDLPYAEEITVGSESHQWYSQLHGRPLVSCAVVWFSRKAMATR